MNKKAVMGTGMNFLIGALVVGILASVLLPLIANNVASAAANENLTNGSGTLLGLLPLFIVIVIVVLFVTIAVKKGKN